LKCIEWGNKHSYNHKSRIQIYSSTYYCTFRRRTKTSRRISRNFDSGNELSQKRVFEWDLESPIELNENGILQIVDRLYLGAASSNIYTIQIIDIASQFNVNKTDGSGIPKQIRLSRGKVLDIGIPYKPFITDVALEMQPQSISKIILLIGITDNIEYEIGTLGYTTGLVNLINYNKVIVRTENISYYYSNVENIRTNTNNSVISSDIIFWNYRTIPNTQI